MNTATRVTQQGHVRSRPAPDPVVFNNTLGRVVRKLDPTTEADPIGVLGSLAAAVSVAIGPEVRTQALFRDRFVGVVRKRHPLSRGKVTPARYAASRHILVSQRGLDKALRLASKTPHGQSSSGVCEEAGE